MAGMQGTHGRYQRQSPAGSSLGIGDRLHFRHTPDHTHDAYR
jgi:hypothetical protein